MLPGMRRFAFFLLLSACSHATSAPPAASPAIAAAASAEAPAPKPADEGTFRVTLAGRDVGTETFTILDKPAGHEIKAKTALQFGERLLSADGTLEADAAWRPVSAKIQRQAGDVTNDLTLARRDDGTLALNVISSKAEPKELVETAKSDLYLGDISFSHLTPLCGLAADEEKTITVFPGQPIKIGAKKPVPDALAGKRTLHFVPFVIADKNTVQLICDGKKAVISRYPELGLVAVRAGYEEVATAIAKAETNKPDVPAGLGELPRQVRSPADRGAVLSCSLLLPADRSTTLPAVVFVTGSGPEDRDDDTPGAGGVKMALFKHIAIALAQAGVASLRCDDRGVAGSTGSMAGGTLNTMVADTSAQVAMLRAEPGIDGSRIGIIGHAEGGIVAPMVAEKDSEIKSLALLGAPGRSLDQVLLAQRDEVNRQEGFKDEYVAREHKRLAGIYAAIRAGKPLPASTTGEERRIIEPAIDWLASHFKHDPLKTLAALKIPVFVVQGGKDVQTSAKDDFERLKSTVTRAGNKRAQAKLYPDLSHLLAPTKTGDIADYSDPDLHVDGDFIADLVGFLKANL